MPLRTMWRGTGVSQEAAGVEENMGKSLYCGFHGKEWARQSEKFQIS